jgi:hypothetical protein
LTELTKSLVPARSHCHDRAPVEISAPSGDTAAQEPAAKGSIAFWPLCPRTGLASDYDFQNVMIYIRLLDAESGGADIGEMARTIFLGGRTSNFRFAKLAAQAHLGRAHWLLEKKFFPLIWALGD